MTAPAEFDAYSVNYDEALNRGLAVSGESREYFARGRVALLSRLVRELELEPTRRIVDLGCGTGDTGPLLFEAFAPEVLLGLDVSSATLEVAARRFGSERVLFRPLAAHVPAGDVDLLYCNGVFHHVAPGKRAELLGTVARTLRPGGLLSLWENNPWNPGTRWVMSRVPFDRDAILLSAREAAQLVRAAGLEVVRVDHLFLFPRALSLLRGIERLVTRFPLGGQYQVLARRPER